MPTTQKYVVVSDAVVVTVGKKANGKAEYTRVSRGGVVNGSPESDQIAGLLAKGAIKQVKSKAEMDTVQADLADPRRSRHRQTVKRAAQSQGAPDDPVAAPVQGVEPVPAPLPELDPDAILADSATE